MNMKVSNAAL